jgi:cysteine desulfurase/selenocysteine lyase
MPDKLESGTLNVPGIAGLGEGVAWVLRRGVRRIEELDRSLRAVFLAGLAEEARISTYEGAPSTWHTGVVSVNVQGISPSVVGEILERKYGILTRIGLHCAPRAHRTLLTFPDGTVRLSWGPFTRERDVAAAARALRELAAGR